MIPSDVSLNHDDGLELPGCWLSTLRRLGGGADTGLETAIGLHIYEKALKSGYLEYRSAVTILTGIAGSGKTSFKHLLCNMPPPEIRQSTPLAEAPIRAMCCVRVDATGEEFKIVDDDEHDQTLADQMATMFSQSASRSQVSESAQVDLPQCSTSDSSNSPPTSTNLEPLCSDDVASNASQQSGSGSHNRSSGSTATSSVTKEISGKFAHLLVSSSHQRDPPTPSCPKRPRRIDMFYVLDSGGQPQYQDLSTLFLSPAAITIFVTNLADTLESHPMIGYYENGRPLSKPQPSPLSHLEVLQHTVQSLQSQAHARGQAFLAQDAAFSQASPSDGSPPSVQSAESGNSSIPEAAHSGDYLMSADATTTGPAILVVGTHKDKESFFFETRAEKNQKLVSLLSPVFGDRLVYYGESNEEVIYPVNARSPGPEDHKAAGEIKGAMLRVVSSVKPKRIPMKWDIVERAMRQMATSRGRPFLTREECLQLARDHHMSESELHVALEHLSRLNLIFYFPEALPSIIFVRTQAFLDKLSELVHRRYELDSAPDRTKSITGVWIRFRDKGLVKFEILEDFPKHYINEANLFTPKHLVQVLLYRSVIAEVGVDEYFMPFILSSLSQKDLGKHRVQPSSNAAPLVITFSGGAVPSGLFPAVVACLLSSRAAYSFELYPSPRDRTAPECVYRNCIKFQLPSGTAGSLVLIDSFTHIEAHVDAPESVCLKLCPLIKNAILGHLEDACRTLKFHRLSPQVSVLCESKVTHGEPSQRPFWHFFRGLFGWQAGEFRHHVNVSMDTNTWACILAPGTIYGGLQARHHLWFPTEMPSDVGPSLKELQCLKWNNNGRQERTRIMDEVAPKWRELGIALEFSAVELDTINQDCPRQFDCIFRLFGEWTLSKPTYSWNGLLEGLRNSGHSNLADRVTNALANRSW